MSLRRTILLTATLVVAACTEGGQVLDPFTGKQVAAGAPELTLDVGEIRLALHPVRTARNYPVPPTVAVSYRWSPAAYDRFFREHGWRRPTTADWERSAAIDATRYPSCPGCTSGALGRTRDTQKADPTAEYKAHVMSTGEVTAAPCDRRASGELVCEPDPKLGIDEQRGLAQRILTAARPGCTIKPGRPKALELDRTGPGNGRIRFGPAEPVLYAEIACP